MLVNGIPRADDLNKVMYDLWYEPEYQWYFAGRTHYPLQVKPENGDERQRCFASVNSKDELMGCLGYHVDLQANSAWGFYAIRFPKGDKLVFGRDMRQCVDDVFTKFGFHRMDFNVVVGNPAEQMYDKYLDSVGGRIVGIQHEMVVDAAGKLHDFKRYEVMARDYFWARYEEEECI